MFSYIGGKFVKTDELSIRVNDDPLGFYRSYRIFTACRTVNGKPFALDDHIDRLFHSAKIIKMPIKEKREEIKNIVNKTTEKNGKGKDLLMEIIYTGGKSGLLRLMPKGPANLLIAVYPLNPPPKNWRRDGIALATYPYQRHFPLAKSTSSYAAAVTAHMELVPKYKAQEILYIDPSDKKTILEGATFNFFIVDKKGIVLTPPLNGKILPGITRKYVIETARKIGITVEEKNITLDDLKSAKEAFLTSTTRNALPVARVNNIKINGPGKLTFTIGREFDKFLKEQCQ